MSGLHDRSSHRETKPAAESSGELPSKTDFEDVLRETLRSVDGSQPSGADEIESLIGVARRHQGEVLQTDRIVHELVETLLRSRFPRFSASPAFWENAIGEIAKTLMNDPRQNALLHRFWSSLCEKAA